MKSKFVCVSPVSYNAKIEFEDLMNKLHSCRVIRENEDKMLLESINKSHHFWISLSDDKNWKIIK